MTSKGGSNSRWYNSHHNSRCSGSNKPAHEPAPPADAAQFPPLADHSPKVGRPEGAAIAEGKAEEADDAQRVDTDKDKADKVGVVV